MEYTAVVPVALNAIVRHAQMVCVYTETVKHASPGKVSTVLPRFASHKENNHNMVFALQFRLLVPAMILFSALKLLVAFNALQTSALSKLGSPVPTPMIVLRMYACFGHALL